MRFFLNGKRRENYDDWWRCEIQFDPVLDEAFGLTHTKQQIRPQAHLLEALAPDIEATARALNGRIRKAYAAATATERFSASEKLASMCEELLDPLPSSTRERDRIILEDLARRHPTLRTTTAGQDTSRQLEYKIVESCVRDTGLYTHARENGRLVLALNPDHPFYKHVYKPLTESKAPQDQKLRAQLEFLLLSLIRAGHARALNLFLLESGATQRVLIPSSCPRGTHTRRSRTRCCAPSGRRRSTSRHTYPDHRPESSIAACRNRRS